MSLYGQANNYIYGPSGYPVEQINNTTGTVTYLHHDQQGSTRLLTGSTGTVTGSTTFDAYGNKTGSTGTSPTPLRYGGQYTSSDTGLIYLRARVYDPATAQFLSVDPIVPLTREPYTYGGNNPLNEGDPTGLDFLEEAGEGIAGWGDTFTFGATNWVREELGINNVDTCSTAYQAGGYTGLATAVLIPGEGEAALGADALRFGGDQNALIQLAKDAKRAGGLTQGDAATLQKWAKEYGLPSRGPEIHPNRPGWAGENLHVHIGPVNHIPVVP